MPDTVRIQCYIEIEYDNKNLGRVVFELWNDKVPKTVENFRCLCTGEKGISANGHRLCYTGTLFHRIVSGFIIQGGDVTHGSGGESIYGGRFADEDLSCKMDRIGLLAMANIGSNRNGSQFFITYVPAPHLTGKHVVFGEVVSGMETLKILENVPVDKTKRPVKDAKILLSGELPAEQYLAKNESQLNFTSQKCLSPRVDLKGRIIKGRGTLSKGSMCKLETNEKIKNRIYYHDGVRRQPEDRRNPRWRERFKYNRSRSPRRYEKNDTNWTDSKAIYPKGDDKTGKQGASVCSDNSCSSSELSGSNYNERKRSAYKPNQRGDNKNGANLKFERPIISYNIGGLSSADNEEY